MDALLDYRYGQLPYRSLRFNYLTERTDSFQEASVVVYPKAEGYTRITEYKKLPPQNIPGVTTVAYEYPMPAGKNGGNEPYYPIQSVANNELYDKYLHDLRKVQNLFLCGRLADYRYYNMDTAILRALETFKAVQTAIKEPS